MKLVLDLEQKALSHDVPITNLLRTALAVAVKLDIPDYVEWVNHELNGYHGVERDCIPQYRFIEGVVKYLNPVHGWQDVVWANQRQYDTFSYIPIAISIAEIEEFSRSESIAMDLPVDMQRNLARHTFGIVPKIIFGNQKFLGILEAVKTNILSWALELERNGVLGEDMIFNEKERRTAENITINNYIGHAENSYFQQGKTNHMNIAANDDKKEILSLLEGISNVLPEINDESTRNEINADIQTIKQQLQSPNPKMNVIREIFSSMRNVMEGMCGSLLASHPTLIDGFQIVLGKLSS